MQVDFLIFSSLSLYSFKHNGILQMLYSIIALHNIFQYNIDNQHEKTNNLIPGPFFYNIY